MSDIGTVKELGKTLTRYFPQIAESVDLDKSIDQAFEKISDFSDETMDKLSELQTTLFGRKGAITGLLRELGKIEQDKRKEVGQLLNDFKNSLDCHIELTLAELSKVKRERALQSEMLDITMPGRRQRPGTVHPLTIVQEEITEIFHKLGFEVKHGPHIETDFYNFEALNFPQWHPARAMQDTFYVDGEKLLRTHTSPVQVRTMLEQKPPIRMIAMGSCFRRDALDATHSPYFHQVEGLMVDKNISFSDLAGIISIILSELFGGDVKVKFLPSYFPFVEPGAETLASCPFCGGKGCNICQQSGWIEMGGSGMVHPNVLEKCGIDPEVYQGFAFGWGIERIAIMKFGIKDIREFTECDTRFLSQFGGVR